MIILYLIFNELLTNKEAEAVLIDFLGLLTIIFLSEAQHPGEFKQFFCDN